VPDAFSFIGRSVLRKEDRRLLTGAGRFGDDFAMPGQTYAAMLRSPHPHAEIRAIDTGRVRAMPGVLAVYTGADCAADGLKPIPHSPVPSTRHDMKLTAPGGGRVVIDPHHLLPTDRVRHVGEAVAMVVAETRDQALDATEEIAVDYRTLPFVTDALGALEAGATTIWSETPGNLLVETRFGDEAATARAFADADHVVTMDFHVGRISAAPMEPRAGLAHYDAASGRYTLYFCTGGPGVVRQRRDFATVLGIAPERLRLVALDTGGSFGSKNRPYVEFGLILWAAKKLGRPVKYTATRGEALLSEYQGRDLVTTVELALRKDGKFLALRADNLMNVGAHCVSLSPLAKGAALITGSYDIPVASLRARAAYSNTTPNNVLRSSGRPEVCFALERAIDTAAREMGIDPLDLRRRNLIAPGAMPYANAVGATYDSGDYASNMAKALRLADWEGFATRRAEAESHGRLRGIGFANYVESSTGSPVERAAITVTPEGRVILAAGMQPSGQGHETSLAQIAADLLGVPVDAIDVILGDTDIVTEGGGSHSGRSMRHAGTVIVAASAELIAKAKNLAARAFDAPEDQITFAEGRFGAPRTDRSLGLLDLATEARRFLSAAELGDALSVARSNEMHEPVFPNGSAVCEVEVDPETGVARIMRYASVDDVGRCINPMLVDGQTHGCIAHGVGEALSERIVIDPRSGQSLTGSFMDYAMPLADTLPSFKTAIVEVLSPTNPLGLKSASEGATTAAPAAVINAIVDALAPLGVRNVTMPATPFTLWRAIKDAAGKRRD
jgi:aerobic carbon-monoxide dehydrogenase large subunit